MIYVLTDGKGYLYRCESCLDHPVYVIDVVFATKFWTRWGANRTRERLHEAHRTNFTVVPIWKRPKLEQLNKKDER